LTQFINRKSKIKNSLKLSQGAKSRAVAGHVSNRSCLADLPYPACIRHFDPYWHRGLV